MSAPLKIGYVPEHFSTPLFFAKKYFGLDAELIPFPSGTGHMITSIRAGEIDVAVGLTEGWIAGLGKEDTPGDGGYRLVGTYVQTPLCMFLVPPIFPLPTLHLPIRLATISDRPETGWAISTGAQRPEISSVASLHNSKIGVSRIGSGSYVMGFVLADQQKWLVPGSAPYSDTVVLNNFANLRNAVNSGEADFFMWEHFTSKKYYDSGEIRRVGEIYTPWSSWKIVASTELAPENGKVDARVTDLFGKIDKGIDHFNTHQEEAVEWISTNLDYSESDAREWLKTVKFADKTEGVDAAVVENCVSILRKADVLKEGKGMEPSAMVVKS
ncbi:hypothetical protein TD95_004170 [Thielaviopsis punctulata]|uniref:Ca3427-like PBP 2 domain-containing protein n=1 Tax=Thielaviopsis punctulata TaxID=72032 RepID=A0A0F4ZHX0_9PEZI|nr:hypothetical protein TD95_004170 [Thielaviopsis punctulata]